MSERDDLKARAEKLELKFAPNLSTDKLAELVAEAEAKAASGQDTVQAGDSTTPTADDGSNSFEEALALAAASQETCENARVPSPHEAAFHGSKPLVG
ncbi:hypothetical protein HCZ87_10990, partial [Phaeobacter sp. HF9A]|nr:hypothetical protein [Phaeobacter sp. HF9A]